MIGLVAQFLGDDRVSMASSAALPAPAGCETDFLAEVCVALAERRAMPIDRGDALAMTEAGMCWQGDPYDGPMIGYVVTVGLRACAGEVIDALERIVGDGTIHWGRSRWHEVGGEQLSRKIRRRIRPMNGDGIWYIGEPAYFNRW